MNILYLEISFSDSSEYTLLYQGAMYSVSLFAVKTYADKVMYVQTNNCCVTDGMKEFF